jgi:hypothetical protein
MKSDSGIMRARGTTCDERGGKGLMRARGTEFDEGFLGEPGEYSMIPPIVLMSQCVVFKIMNC